MLRKKMRRYLQQKKIDPDLLLMLACYPNPLLLRANSVVLTQFFSLEQPIIPLLSILTGIQAN